MITQRRTPLVSIGMPVWNCAGTVGEALSSILNQTLDDWELLVVDDSSGDRTVEVVMQFDDPRIRLIVCDRHRGLPACLNEILRQAEGVYFARMDGDDISYPDRLAKQVEFLEAHGEIDLVAGAMMVFDKDNEAIGVRRGPRTHDQICAHPLAGFPLAHPTWMGRTEWFRRHPYREDAVRMEDWDLLYRAHRESRFANLDDVVLAYREPSLNLRKQAEARWNKCRSLFQHARRGESPIKCMGEAAQQAFKLAADMLAVGSGLNHRLLRHRAGSMTRAERDEWHDVERAVSDAAARCYGKRECIPA